jgi:hypothetical protein
MYGCVIEDQPQVMRVQRYQGIRLEGVRFEGNATGENPVCLFEDCNGIYIQAFNRVLNAEDSQQAPNVIELRRCRDYDIAPTMGGVKIWRKWEPRY